jgi:hypothetical protein
MVLFSARTLILALWFVGPVLTNQLMPRPVNMFPARRIVPVELEQPEERLVLVAEAGLK